MARPLRSILTLATLLVASVSFAQWQFKLDTTFRTQIIHEYVNSLILEPDGNLIVSGVMRFPGEMSDKRLVRLLPNGIRDETYNNSGLGGGKLTPWEDGKFYVGSGQGVRRILPTGQNDPSYILNGGPYFSSIQGGDYHVFDDGRVLVAGSHLLSDSIRGFMGNYHLIWFSNEGYLDTTRIHRQTNGLMWRFTALPNGKFLCSCFCTIYDGQPVGRIFRIHEDGSLDTSFQSDVNTGWIFAYLPLEDGRVMVGGNFQRASDPDQLLQLVRFMPDGSLDPTFNNYMHFDVADGINSIPKVNNIVHWQDDMYFIMGVFRNVDGETRGGICVVDSTGQLLPYMDQCLPGTFTYFGNTMASALGIAPTLDGTAFYIWGGYAGYTDGTINDPGQRFVSRLLVEEDTTVGVAAAVPKVPGFGVFPNPSSGTVHLNIEGRAHHGMAEVRDALGRLVHVQRIAATGSTLDLQALPDGLYFVNVITTELHFPAQRLVLQR